MIRIYQIYFKPEQLESVDYIPYLNSECTPFFENSVINHLVKEEKAHEGSEYFGVVSWKLKHKIGITKENWKNHKNIANKSVNEFTPALFEIELLKGKPDAMSFQRHMPHDPVRVANGFHPNFSKYFQHIMNQIGYKWNHSLFLDVFYCNYFVAKSELYEKYVIEMLSPAIDVMQEMPELFNNSQYPHKLPADLKQKFGIDHYPYHPFICERMFSYFAHLHKLKCLHY